MEEVVLVIHLILALAIIGLVMLQRSEGGGLGIGGGGGGMGSLASASSTKNILTKATSVCAGCFFITSLILAILAGGHNKTNLLDNVENLPSVVDTEVQSGDNEIPEADKKIEADAPVPTAPIAE